MKVWTISTVDHRTGEIRESAVIDTTDQPDEAFRRSQQERFGDRFVKAKIYFTNSAKMRAHELPHPQKGQISGDYT